VLSLAEAAAWVGIGHLALRAALDAAEVQLIGGMRRGRALRLVRVCDLRVVFPAVATTPSPGADWFTEVCPEDEVPGALFDGLSRLRPSAGGPLAPPSPLADQESDGGSSRKTVDASSGGAARYKGHEPDRTGAEVAVTEDGNAPLKRERLSSADAVKVWLDCVRDDSPGKIPPAVAPVAAPAAALEVAPADAYCPTASPVGSRPAPNVLAKVPSGTSWQNRLTPILGGLLVVGGLVAGSGLVGGMGWGQREPVADRAPASVPQTPADASQNPWASSDSSAQDLGAPFGAPLAGLAPVLPGSWGGPSSQELFEAGMLGMEPMMAAPTAVADPPLAPSFPAPPMVVAPGSAILGTSLGESEEVGVSCLYFAVTRPGMESRELIGPCHGAWSPRLGAVTASHHRGEHSVCRGHDHFDRTMGGSIVRAREMAMVAKSEGLLSPLLSLRVERSAASMLREEVPVWIQSGFEAGLLGVGHIVEPMETTDHWRVRSWVRYMDFAGVEMRRNFELLLALGDGPRGDVVLSLEWQED
jgi:hypothetical protein